MDASSAHIIQPRKLGAVNWLGLWTLTCKETVRFVKVYTQTILAPVITTLLFYLVFDLALGGGNREVNGVPYMEFLPPGLIMMSMAQNAFANTSSSIVISKVQGNMVDVLMAPLSPMEFTLGYTFGGIARGLAVGTLSVFCLVAFADMPMAHPEYVLYHAIMGSMMLALLGIIGGIWSEKFDHMAAVQNFIIMPATFLSGTFYSADRLPEAWRFLCHLNPFFLHDRRFPLWLYRCYRWYAGFRYGTDVSGQCRLADHCVSSGFRRI